MSEGSVFQRKDGKWCAKWKDATGKWRYLYRRTKGDAKKALRQALKDRDEGICPTGRTLNDALDAWLEDMRDDVSLRTWLNRESLIRCHVKPHRIGSKKIADLTPEDVRRFHRDVMGKGLAHSTVGRLHSLLKSALKDAVRLKHIRTNPVEGVKPPRTTQSDMEVLSAPQVRQLLDAVREDRMEGVYVLGATCGLRVGEALSVRHEDLNLYDGTLHVRRTLWRGKTYQPKTNSSRRTIKLPAVALEALRRNALRNGSSDGWLFPSKSGTPVAPSNFWRWYWKPMLRNAGLPESLTFHQLRHSAASLLLSQGVPIPVVSNYLGHANPSVTLRVYAHVIDGTSGIAAAAMDGLLGDGPRRDEALG